MREVLDNLVHAKRLVSDRPVHTIETALLMVALYTEVAASLARAGASQADVRRVFCTLSGFDPDDINVSREIPEPYLSRLFEAVADIGVILGDWATGRWGEVDPAVIEDIAETVRWGAGGHVVSNHVRGMQKSVTEALRVNVPESLATGRLSKVSGEDIS